MTNSDYITVELSEGRNLDLQVEEFHPLDPAAYVLDPGWTAYAPDGTEYFVSQSGAVYVQPSNADVGIAPAIREACDRMEAQISEAMGNA